MLWSFTLATYYIIAAGSNLGVQDPGNVNGYPQVNAGTVITAQPGDVFIVDNGFNASTTIQTTLGGSAPVEVQFNQSITGLTATNQAAITFTGGVIPTVNIAAAVDADSVQLIGTASDGITVNVADGATVGQIFGSPDTDVITAGNGVTFNGIVLNDSTTATVSVGDNVTFNTQVTMNALNSTMSLTAGDNALFNTDINIPGNFSDKTVSLGSGATVNGSVNMFGDGVAGDLNTMTFTAGADLTVTGNVVMASNYGNTTFLAGDNASIGVNLDVHSNYSTNTVVLGANSDVGANVLMNSNYSDNDLKIGDNTIVGKLGAGSVLMNSNFADNCLAIGNNVTIKGDLNLGSNASDQLVRAGNDLNVSASVVLGAVNANNGVEIGNNLFVGGNLVGSNNLATPEYLKVGDNWSIVGNIAMSGGTDNLILGQPAPQQTVITGDGLGGNGISVEAPAGQEAAFGAAATAANWKQNGDGSWSPTGVNQYFAVNGIS